MARRFVMGDVHGAFRAMQQCFQRSGFNNDTDLLISLGDVCDGWPDTRQCIEQLLKIKNLVFVLGNHDFHTLEWAEYGHEDEIWLEQGGLATQQSYRFKMPDDHIDFLRHAKTYWVTENRLFVHAGILPGRHPEECALSVLLWDRTLVHRALDLYRDGRPHSITAFDEIFVGHTPIGPYPLKGGEVWMMDTGAGWSGVLTMMDIDTKEVYQSDHVPELYPGVVGRTKKS